LGRLQSNLNRAEIAFGRYAFRPDTRQLLRNGQPIVLNGKAFDLLAIFLESGGRALTREELYGRLWGDRVVEEANLSQTVYLLRRTLDPDGDGRAFVETIPRVGYRFVHPLREELAPPRRLGFAAAAIALCAVALAVTAWMPLGRPAAISSAARDADELGEYHLVLRTPDHLSYALTYFKEAERAAPRDAFAFAGAAAAYALLAEFQADGSPRQRALVSSAIASSAAALRRNAGYSRALAVRGFVAYRFQNDRDSAARDLGRAIAADPNDAEAYLWRGILSMTEGNLAAATSDFRTARRIAPTSEVYSRWLARAYAFAGKPEQAIAEAREALRIEPDDAPAMLMIAGAQEQRGDLRAAIVTLRALLREDPYERPFVIPDVARLELRIAKPGTASAAYLDGTLALSGRADPFETALLYLTTGRKAEGMQMLRRTNRSTLAVQRYDPRLLALL
jgi:DNA-binding winged helix-turn-helix (wHTH) protein